MPSEAIRKLRYVYSVEGDQKVISSSREVERAIDSQESNVVSLQQRYDELARSQRRLITQQNEQKAAFQAANDNAAASGRSFGEMASETINLASHLKLAAAAAYLAIPAFRSLTNQAAVAGVGALAGQFGTLAQVTARVGTALGPALSFIGRISIPITAAVAAFELFNATLQKGSELLDKFGTAGQRGRFADESAVSARLAELTRFQQETVTEDQARRAGELARRLEDAKFTLAEFAKIQFDLTEPALHLQSIWVSIVETIARGVSLLPAFKELPSIKGAPATEPFVDPLSGATFGPGGQFAVPRGSKGDRLISAQEQLRVRMTGGFAGRFSGIIPPAEKAQKEIKDTASEFDRLANSIERQTAAMEADAETVGKTAGEVAKLRTEYRLWESAQQEVLKKGGDLADYADRIRLIADRAAIAAQRLDDARVRFSSIQEFSRTVTGDLSKGLVDIATGARTAGDAFKDFGLTVERALVQMVLKLTLFNQLERSLSSGLSSFLPTVGVGAAAPTGPTALTPPVSFASGGVLGGPRIFPMAGGLGLAGEAGPEAVMPLRRDSAGRLGVSGAGSGDQVVNVQIVNSGAPVTATTQQSRGADGSMNLKVFLDQVEGRIADNVRRGRGPMGGALTGRYGLNPARGNVA